MQVHSYIISLITKTSLKRQQIFQTKQQIYCLYWQSKTTFNDYYKNYSNRCFFLNFLNFYLPLLWLVVTFWHKKTPACLKGSQSAKDMFFGSMKWEVKSGLPTSDSFFKIFDPTIHSGSNSEDSLNYICYVLAIICILKQTHRQI